MSIEYSVHIIWSQEDSAYIAHVFELAGCAADGQTPEEALRNVRVIAKEWIEVAKEEGRTVPPPMTLQAMQKESEKFQAGLQKHIQNEVQAAVQRVMKQLVSSSVAKQSFYHRLVFDPELEPA